ncbi:hypothetical protein [Papillibacter cinnamivorans]|uniref:Uncharacterized protein n=1 Tax=Papillibacter cinnamivorans DSM 12816 TaxID=1122930 RepID=A0A1W2CQV9_9FIRM|nr:hypothetical protein [Papillibacter cinnamivorans]SMC87620.1 hypothetical protein SAMN02745168_0176 [Papillibacter cinnamivorans DSM 12816]
MDSHYKMMRATVGVAITRAVSDIETDTKRAVRNLVDLGTQFASGENQKKFFVLANDVLANPQNPYNKMVLELTRNVDKKIIKTVGTNLGFSSLIYGVKQIREELKQNECNIPWLIIFQIKPGDPDALITGEIESLIEQGRKLGIFSYVFTLSGKEKTQADTALLLAEKYYDCFFLLTVRPEIVDEHFAKRVREVENVAVSVRTKVNPQIGTPSRECQEAFSTLHSQRCMFGFHTLYSRENVEMATSVSWLEQMIACHCLFGGYVLKNEEDEELAESVHKFCCEIRGGNGKTILAFEWEQDTKFISGLIAPRTGILRLDSLGKILWKEKDMGSARGKTLKEILHALTPPGFSDPETAGA